MLPVSRRSFLGSVASLTSLHALPTAASVVEYIAAHDRIDVFRTHSGLRKKTQSVSSRKPASLTLDNSRHLLFAVNQISEYQSLPAGSVESYAVQPENGPLSLISRRSLSLSATLPRNCAISPDGRFLVVAAFGGGAYNILPIFPDGQLGNPCCIFKETASSVHPLLQRSSHPHSVLFSSSGQFLLSTDLGADRISVFKFNQGSMLRTSYAKAPPGTGPAQLALEPSTSTLSVTHVLTPLISHYRFDQASGRLTRYK